MMISLKFTANGVKSSGEHLKLFKNILKNFKTTVRNSTSKKYETKIEIPENAKNVSEIAHTTPMKIGRGFLAGSSAVGLGCLVYYGLGLSSEIGVLEKSSTWSQKIRKRVHSTYMYLGGSLTISACSAILASRSKLLMAFVEETSRMAQILTSVAIFGSLASVLAIPYKENEYGAKQIAWALHTAIFGTVLAPLVKLGGPLLIRAAWYTAGVVGGLSLIAATAPSEKFLGMGGFLGMCLGFVCAVSIADVVLQPTSLIRVANFASSLYGGVVLFSLCLLYNTQAVIKKAETSEDYDPVVESLNIYLDVINLFIRILTILFVNEAEKSDTKSPPILTEKGDTEKAPILTEKTDTSNVRERGSYTGMRGNRKSDDK